MFSFSFYMVDIQTEMVGGLADEWGKGRLKSMWADVATMLFPFPSRSQLPPPLDLQRRIFFSSEPSAHSTKLKRQSKQAKRKAISAPAAFQGLELFFDQLPQQQHTVTHSVSFSRSQDIAAYIKKEFDKKYNPTWHCIVGRNFGSYVTHETRHFIYFYLGQVAILLFKSG